MNNRKNLVINQVNPAIIVGGYFVLLTNGINSFEAVNWVQHWQNIFAPFVHKTFSIY